MSLTNIAMSTDHKTISNKVIAIAALIALGGMLAFLGWTTVPFRPDEIWYAELISTHHYDLKIHFRYAHIYMGSVFSSAFNLGPLQSAYVTSMFLSAVVVVVPQLLIPNLTFVSSLALGLLMFSNPIFISQAGWFGSDLVGTISIT